MADRASAGFLEPFPFLEYKTAFLTFCGDYRQLVPGRMHRTFDMLKVAVDILLRDMHFCRYILCRQCLVLQDREDLMPDCLMPFSRHERFLWLLLFYHAFL